MKLLNWILGRGTVAADEPPSPKSIYELAREINDRFEEVSHPSELVRDAAFAAAVRAVVTSDCSSEQLVHYTLAENERVASLALCALAARLERGAVDGILEQINDYSGRWAKYFALETLHRLVPPPAPLLGRLFVALNDDWSDGYDRFLTQFIRELTSRRVQGGEQPTFDGALAKADSSRLDDVHELLGRIDRDIAAPMREELRAVRRSKTNLDFFRSFGRVWGDDQRPRAIEHEMLNATVDLIVETLTAERRRSVLVAGVEGVGKTTAIHAAAERLRADGWTIFEAGATELGAGQTYIGQLEERVQKMVKNMRGARRVVWLVPNFHELQYAGAHRYSPGGALEMVLPHIDAGEMVVIGEIGMNAWQRLAERKQGVRSAFVTVRVDPLRAADTLALARSWVDARGSVVRDDALTEAWQLTTQYLGARAAPGNLLELLELTHARLRSVDDTVTIELNDVLETLSQLTGLPLNILDDRTGLDLDALRAQFASRVLGQPEAVDVLAERVAMIKAGVTDPTRPSGVFLFAGPTGTGKTEIAKSLAASLFGSAERMIRVDMSELKTPDSLGRLIGDESGDGASSLVTEIRKQPFSVVLLDELEKAHPHVWDLFLQVFDDGRLTDRRGATADFRHAIIIMTSNIGSAIRTYGRAGFSEAAGAMFQSADVMKALEQELRKEFLNRIDRVVVFQPLTRETMRGILEKELAQAFHRRGLRNRDWIVEWDESALDFLLAAGFTADLGARPLKRAVERHLLTPLAELIVTRRVPAGDQCVFVRAEEGALRIDFTSRRAHSVTSTRTSSPFARMSGTYIACPRSGRAWNEPGISARRV